MNKGKSQRVARQLPPHYPATGDALKMPIGLCRVPMRDTEWVRPDKREPGRAKKPRGGLFCKCRFKDAWRRVVDKHGFSAFYMASCVLFTGGDTALPSAPSSLSQNTPDIRKARLFSNVPTVFRLFPHEFQHFAVPNRHISTADIIYRRK